LLRACDEDLAKLMRMIDLTPGGQLNLRHFDLMMSYERFMPEKASIKAQ
jgi:hypothetical protein